MRERLGRPDSAFRGGYLGTKECSGNKCTIQCSQMFTEKTCTATGAESWKLGEELAKKCGGYVQQVKEQLNAFWEQRVLNSAKIWKKYSEEAEKALDATRCTS